MKLYIVFVFAALTVVSEEQLLVTNSNMRRVLVEWEKVVEPFNTECMCQSGVTQDLLDRLWGYGEIPNEPCFKCAIKCWAQHMQFMSPEGVLDTVKFQKTIYGVDSAIARKCGSIPGVDICQKSYEIFVCTYRILVGLDPHPSVSSGWNTIPYVFGINK